MRSVWISLVLLAAVLLVCVGSAILLPSRLSRLSEAVGSLGVSSPTVSQDAAALLRHWQKLSRFLTCFASDQRLEPISELFLRLQQEALLQQTENFLLTQQLLCHQLQALRDALGLQFSSIL